uniref:Family with sequence similarity 83 member A n=1 Tax=Podarcis muralis TaxID=64176 RepID=A0A670JSL2_PODMU
LFRKQVSTSLGDSLAVNIFHNESVRLATDALLDGGLQSYLKALDEEGEVDFLSTVEAQYIKRNMREPYYASDTHPDGETGPRQNNDTRSLQSGTYFPLVSESSEPALLHTWSASEKPYLKEKSSATVYFQTDKNSNIRDLIRRCINKTSQVLAILMDVFTDTEIFCDVLEAANKRRVFVYLLLDHSNLKLFTEMCDKLHVAEGHFKNISVRSVTGEVYCAKSGRKFSGQIQEKFIISDWRYVLSGSYSFTWLCGQVHRNFLSKFTGQVVELFDEEFRHLYALSKPVAGLRPPSHTSLFLLNKSTAATQGSLTNSSNQGSLRTPSDPFSCPSNHSGSRSRQPPKAPVRSSHPASPSPLSRSGGAFTMLTCLDDLTGARGLLSLWECLGMRGRIYCPRYLIPTCLYKFNKISRVNIPPFLKTHALQIACSDSLESL